MNENLFSQTCTKQPGLDIDQITKITKTNQLSFLCFSCFLSLVPYPATRGWWWRQVAAGQYTGDDRAYHVHC